MVDFVLQYFLSLIKFGHLMDVCEREMKSQIGRWKHKVCKPNGFRYYDKIL